MDLKSLYTFLDSITLPVQFLGFENEFVSFPAPFTVLGKLNSVTSKSRKTGKTVIFKDFLKRSYSISLEESDETYLTDERGNKRKHTESDAGGEPSKRVRNDLGKSCSQCSFKKDLCDHEVVDLQSDEVTEAMKNLNNFLNKDNLHCLFKVLESSRDEGDLEIGLGIHLISKLTGNAFTRRWKAQRDCICGCTEKLGASDEMYIGSQNTWYGELDILAGNPGSGRTVAVTICESVKDDRDDNEDEEEDLSDSPGNRTNTEVKSQTDGSDFNQAVAQSIVFAFTEFNRHTDKGCVIPSVLIDKTMYYVVMYNPVTDILISFSNTYNFGPKAGNKGEFIRAILVLWVTLNHRIFFAKFPKLRDEQQSEFGSKINNLQKYRELKNFSKIIRKRNTDDFNYPIGVSYLDVSNSRETFTVFKEIETSVMNKTEIKSDNK